MKNLFALVASLFILSSSYASHVDVDQWDYIPTLNLDIHKDTMSGWNINIISHNFIFDPANAGAANKIGHGHGHLYVNDVKVARVYGSWFHLPSSLFKKGMNTIKVSLNANSHEAFYYKGAPIEAEVMVHFDESTSHDDHNHSH